MRVFAFKSALQGICRFDGRHQTDLLRQIPKNPEGAQNFKMAALFVARLNKDRELRDAVEILVDPFRRLLAPKASVKLGQFHAIGIKPVGHPKEGNRGLDAAPRRVRRFALHIPQIKGQGFQGISAASFYLSKFVKMLPIKPGSNHRRGHENRTTPT